MPVLRVFSIRGSWGSWSQLHPDQVLRDTQSNLGSSALHLTSNEALLFFQGHLGVELYLF